MSIQHLVNGGDWRDNFQSPDWFGRVVATVLELDVTKKHDRARIMRMQATWIENGAFVVVDGKDKARKDVKFIKVGQWQNDTSAPPRNGGAERGGAAERSTRSTTTPALKGAGGGAGGGDDGHQVERSVHGNPALGQPRDFSRWEKSKGPILAPGETGNEPMPGWEEFQ